MTSTTKTDAAPSRRVRRACRDRRPRLPALSAPGRVPRAMARAEPDWFNAPVPSFGPLDARAADRRACARRAEAPTAPAGLSPATTPASCFTTRLTEYGFARGTFEARPDDGLTLVDARITNAVRCVPPENKPTPAEIATCRRFLSGAAHRRDAEAARHRRARPHRARKRRCARSARSAHAAPFGHGAQARRSARSRCSTAIIARATTRTPAC